VSVVNHIDTQHQDMLHDAQLDYYGKRLATCSSDRSIRVFDVDQNGQYFLSSTLINHEGPVWQVAWSHPMFGNLLASCSYDCKVIIWAENNKKWSNLYTYTGHDSSVNSVCWAPIEYGIILASGSSDGSIAIISNTDGNWSAKKISNAHTIGCNAVSWAPSVDAGSLFDVKGDPKPNVKRLVTGGCDYKVNIWKEIDGEWKLDQSLDGHSDWVRDVAWAPNIGVSVSTIASCGEDGRVIIWTKEEDNSEREWTSKILLQLDKPIWHVSWSVTGNILAVSSSDNKVSLWKEGLNGDWVCIDDVKKTEVTEETEKQE
ncbi:uncharacterized protein TRIADDRAFT_24138, partial [Trichoplax adhaerens]